MAVIFLRSGNPECKEAELLLKKADLAYKLRSDISKNHLPVLIDFDDREAQYIGLFRIKFFISRQLKLKKLELQRLKKLKVC